MKVKLIVDGGKMQPGPAVSQQLGPMGINLGKVISKVNEATSGFQGIKVPVEIDVNPKTKDFTIAVFSPPVAELIKKSLNLEKGSGQPNTMKIGNTSVESLIGIAKTKMPDLLANDLKSALKLVVGTCVSLGVLVDSKEAKEIENEIDNGTYDNEIKNEITEPSEEKKKQLDEFFKAVKAKQEKAQKAAEEEAAKKAAEAAVPAAAEGQPQAQPKAEEKKAEAKEEKRPAEKDKKKK